MGDDELLHLELLLPKAKWTQLAQRDSALAPRFVRVPHVRQSYEWCAGCWCLDLCIPLACSCPGYSCNSVACPAAMLVHPSAAYPHMHVHASVRQALLLRPMVAIFQPPCRNHASAICIGSAAAVHVLPNEVLTHAASPNTVLSA